MFPFDAIMMFQMCDEAAVWTCKGKNSYMSRNTTVADSLNQLE